MERDTDAAAGGDRPTRSVLTLARDRRFVIEAVVVLAVLAAISVWLLPEGNSLLTLPVAGLYLALRGRARRSRPDDDH
ncbi:hypothetical protein AB0O91_39875 [Kitasatospora sp. NPDC089797]|uniref:hypothetical protein n=1 Tax=Kitasatospora sp. NPDC089797 TaxID=3155298 RepID=UPI0034202A84